jgi:hypothetical protein
MFTNKQNFSNPYNYLDITVRGIDLSASAFVRSFIAIISNTIPFLGCL